MTYTVSKATPVQIAGRIVGEMNSHIAVTAFENDSDPKRGYLLAVRRDGNEYATWAYGWNMAEDGINVWWGRYFLTDFYDSHFDAFSAAMTNLLERKAGVMP